MTAYIYAVEVYPRTANTRGLRIVREEIIVETAKRITTEGACSAFNYRSHHDPDLVHRTPSAARDAFVILQRSIADRARETAQQADALANRAELMVLDVEEAR